MVKISLNYQGKLRCTATHAPSGSEFRTDAPSDNNGLGQSFSPTDLIATALGSCMATVMGIIAERKRINLADLNVTVRKFMSEDTPRRIAKLELDLHMPIPSTHPEARVLEAAARGCPVHHSLHPEIKITFNWIWTNQ